MCRGSVDNVYWEPTTRRFLFDITYTDDDEVGGIRTENCDRSERLLFN